MENWTPALVMDQVEKAGLETGVADAVQPILRAAQVGLPWVISDCRIAGLEGLGRVVLGSPFHSGAGEFSLEYDNQRLSIELGSVGEHSLVFQAGPTAPFGMVGLVHDGVETPIASGLAGFLMRLRPDQQSLGSQSCVGLRGVVDGGRDGLAADAVQPLSAAGKKSCVELFAEFGPTLDSAASIGFAAPASMDSVLHVLRRSGLEGVQPVDALGRMRAPGSAGLEAIWTKPWLGFQALIQAHAEGTLRAMDVVQGIVFGGVPSIDYGAPRVAVPKVDPLIREFKHADPVLAPQQFVADLGWVGPSAVLRFETARAVAWRRRVLFQAWFRNEAAWSIRSFDGT